jgi:hypothetical protein
LARAGLYPAFQRSRELATRTFEVVQRRFDRDRDLADLFLKAKSPSEIEREAVPPSTRTRQAPPPARLRLTRGPVAAAPLTSEPLIILCLPSLRRKRSGSAAPPVEDLPAK